MSQRIFSLTTYLFRSLLFSLAGLLYILLTLAFYIIFFDPRQRTPDTDYFILVIGLFGLALSFLTTLSVSARANQAVYFPFLVKLPSRVEYLTAVISASLLYVALVEGVLAILSLAINGPSIDFIQALVILPLWVSADLLFVALALHATDLVTLGWSRVYVFGILGLLLYMQSGTDLVRTWLSELFNGLGSSLLSANLNSLAAVAFDISGWFSTSGISFLDGLFGFIFWPFRAITTATISGSFSFSQALAPAILILYATCLFILASRFFAKKDLFLTE